VDRGRRAPPTRRLRSEAWWFQRVHLQCEKTLVTPFYDKWSASNDPRPCGSVECSAPALIRLINDPCSTIGWRSLARKTRPAVLQFAFCICKLKLVSMANGSSLSRQRGEVVYSWLGRSDTDSCFRRPQQGHVVSEEQTSCGPVCLKIHIYRQSPIFRGDSHCTTANRAHSPETQPTCSHIAPRTKARDWLRVFNGKRFLSPSPL